MNQQYQHGAILEAIQDKVNAERFKDAIYVFSDSEDEDSAYF